MEARGEKINVSSGPSKEIAGLKKMKMMMMMMIMTPASQDSRVWECMKRSRYVGAQSTWAQRAHV